MRNRIAGGLAALAIVGGGALMFAPAASATEEKNCVVDLDTKTTKCYSSAAAADQDVARSDKVRVAKIFRKTGFEGDTYTFKKRQGCSAGYGDNEGTWDLNGWRDRVSSVKTYHHCDAKFYDTKTDNWSTWVDRSSDMRLGSDWNNRADYVRLS